MHTLYAALLGIVCMLATFLTGAAFEAAGEGSRHIKEGARWAGIFFACLALVCAFSLGTMA